MELSMNPAFDDPARVVTFDVVRFVNRIWGLLSSPVYRLLVYTPKARGALYCADVPIALQNPAVDPAKVVTFDVERTS
jgi:hypothetical protein